MQVSVIGAGYVGLVTGAGLASLGHRVKVGEIDAERLDILQRGDVPFYEPDLGALVAEEISTGRLSFHASNAEAVEGSRVVFLAVPTPERPDGSGDISALEEVIDEIIGDLAPAAIVACRSTVPVGTARRLTDVVRATRAHIAVLSNPEFLQEGSALRDFLNPSRIVVGTDAPYAVTVLEDVYAGIAAPWVVTDPTSAETIKYASNAYLATRVSFVNEMANLCEALGANGQDVLAGIGYDPRIRSEFLSPGPGFGGSCLPKDARALIATAEEAGHELWLLETVLEVNREQLRRMVARVRSAVGGDLSGKTVALWGLAFKAGVDDTRESPAVGLAMALVVEGAAVHAYDPIAQPVDHGLVRVDSPIEAAKEADVLVIATGWPEFRHVDLAEVRHAMNGDLVVDVRNVLDAGTVERFGMRYIGVGNGDYTGDLWTEGTQSGLTA